MYKLKQNGISGKLFDIITDFLNFRKQRVVLNGQCSSWTVIEAGVPEGSIIGPLLFLIYINDLSDDVTTNVKLFADDTSFFSIVLSNAIFNYLAEPETKSEQQRIIKSNA